MVAKFGMEFTKFLLVIYYHTGDLKFYFYGEMPKHYLFCINSCQLGHKVQAFSDSRNLTA